MPTALTADAFARLRLRYGAEPEPGELPAAVEHDFDAGRMVDHYLATPAPYLRSNPPTRPRALKTPACDAVLPKFGRKISTE